MPGTGNKGSTLLQFELLDETLDLNSTESYHLSIQASTNGLLYAILDPRSTKYIGLKKYRFEKAADPDERYEQIQNLLTNDPFLQRSYLGVYCLQVESRSTLLPAALFERNQLKLYFEFNHVLNTLDELHYNHLKKIDAFLVFPIHSEIAGLYARNWMNVEFFHQAVPLIDSLLSGDTTTPEMVGINFSEEYFDIVVVREKQLKYHNNFRFRTEEDLLYFMLFVFDKLGLDQERTPVMLAGEIDKFSERPNQLKKYFKKISFASSPGGFQYPPSYQKLQEHMFMNLTWLYKCG